MKAIVQDSYGSTDVLRLEDIAPPALAEDRVLLRVHAAGVDRGVWHLMTGQPYLVRLFGVGLLRPRQRVRGMDVSGTVEAVGAKVTDLRPGDAVFGTCDGSFAELASAPAIKLVRKPASLSFEEAAALPISGATALQGLCDVGRVQSGQKVLVIGAAGGVGTFAVQIARALGAEVTGVCSTSKLDLVRSLGAVDAIDYTREDFTDGRRRYDVIFDLAGNRPLSQLRRALRPGGTLILGGGEGGGPWFGGMGRQLGALVAAPFVRHRLRSLLAFVRPEDLRRLSELVEKGQVRPVVERAYALDEAAAAIDHMVAGKAKGKLVLRVRGEA